MQAAWYARFLPSQVAGLGPGIQDDGDACEPRFGVSTTPRSLACAYSKLLAAAHPRQHVSDLQYLCKFRHFALHCLYY